MGAGMKIAIRCSFFVILSVVFALAARTDIIERASVSSAGRAAVATTGASGPQATTTAAPVVVQTPAQAVATIATVGDIKRVRNKLVRDVETTFKVLLSDSLVRAYLKTNQELVEAREEAKKARAQFLEKRNAYAKRVNSTELVALEADYNANSRDPQIQKKFFDVLKKADLKDEWEDSHKRAQKATEASGVRSRALQAVSPANRQELGRYEAQMAEIDRLIEARRSALR